MSIVTSATSTLRSEHVNRDIRDVDIEVGACQSSHPRCRCRGRSMSIVTSATSLLRSDHVNHDVRDLNIEVGFGTSMHYVPIESISFEMSMRSICAPRSFIPNHTSVLISATDGMIRRARPKALPAK